MDIAVNSSEKRVRIALSRGHLQGVEVLECFEGDSDDPPFPPVERAPRRDTRPAVRELGGALPLQSPGRGATLAGPTLETLRA